MARLPVRFLFALGQKTETVLQKLVPEIKKEDLEVAPSGVRAQACHINGDLIDDFYIQQNQQFIHVLNAPSPAATSSLSIGLTVAELLDDKSV